MRNADNGASVDKPARPAVPSQGAASPPRPSNGERQMPMEAKTFTCCDCGETKPVNPSGGTGYAVFENGRGDKVCYACCAIRDKARMTAESRVALYLVTRENRLVVSNWPGTLEFPVMESRAGAHNIAGSRIDAWFVDHDGSRWHGVQYGDNTQLIHCRKLKAA